MDEENASSTNSIKLELRIYMHCKACERSVRRAIENIEGVEKVEVERGENKVTVTGGDFEPEKVVRRIKKKTGKKAEMLANPEEDDHEEDGGGGDAQAHEFQRHAYVPYYHHPHHLVPVPYAYVLSCYDHPVPVPVPLDSGGGADWAHEFQRRGDMGHYAYYAPCCYDGRGGGGDVAHEIQRPARSEWDLHCFDDENTEACRVM